MPGVVTRLLTAASLSACLLAAPGHIAAADAAPPRVEKDWGRTGAPDGVLARGCTTYPYRYKLTLPSDDWEMELVIKDPKGRRVWSAYLLSDSEPTSGKRWFRLCRASASPGRFTIRAKVSVWDGWDEQQGRLPDGHFRLRRR